MEKSWTDFRKADKLFNKAMVTGMTNLGSDVRKRAVILAPYAPKKPNSFPKHLRETARVDVNTKGDTVRVSFNTPYAKRRHYENNLHPSTKFYLTNALKSITNVGRYFRRLF